MENLDELLSEMEAFAAENHVNIINSRGRHVLLEIVREVKPHRVLELGTAIGYSAILIAHNAAPDVEIITMELIEKRLEAAAHFIPRSPYAHKIRVIPGDAGESITKLPRENRYDFVYIDAAKGQYLDYFNKVYPLLTDDAVVLSDNVLFRGYVEHEAGIPRRMRTIAKRLREYIDVLTHHPEFDTVIRKDGDGLAVSRRKKENKIYEET